MARPKEWTIDACINVAQGMFDWMMEDESHLYMMRYLCVVQPLYRDWPSQQLKYWKSQDTNGNPELTSKVKVFSRLLKRCKAVQETRLLETVGKGEIKSMFVLKNHHGYADKQEIKQSSINYNYNAKDLRDKTQDELEEALLNLSND
jgi:hypothetical protein